jgi:cytochrome oxidase Cu insertion factor (SCO1/SenC/PrrC family)
MRRWGRVAIAALGLGGASGAVPPPAPAHEARQLEDEFIRGVFSPAFQVPPAGSYALPVIKRVGEFVLRDSEGRPVSTRAVRAGKVAVVSFIYTACSDRLGCPLATVALHDLQTRLRAEGLERKAVLMSISFDRTRDDTAQLARYARAYAADPALWRFFTTPSEPVLERVLDSYGQDRAPVYDERGQFTGRYRHVLKVFLVDPAGNVRNIYSSGFLVPELVINDIKTVLGGPAIAPGIAERASP